MEVTEHLKSASSFAWSAKLVPLQGSDAPADILVTHMASRILTARSSAPLAPGLPVRIDQSDTILLGEVVACREETPGEFSLLIEMNESLSGLHNLRKLVGALLGEARAGEPRHPMIPVVRRQAEPSRRTERAE